MRNHTRTTAVLALLLLLSACTSAFCGKIVYVKTTGLDTADGLSWATAKRSVTAALTAAVAGDEVWVAAGTYYGGVTLKSEVGLYGGFLGTEIARSERNWTANLSVFQGGGYNRAVVVSPTGATASTLIDGFTITSGQADNGGGISCVSSSPTISNNRIVTNTASAIGGAIYCTGSSAVIVNNTISGNRAADQWDRWGECAGIYCLNSSALRIEGNTIADNFTGGNGGGIWCRGGTVSIIGNEISGNCADGSGGGIYLRDCTAAIFGNTISADIAGNYGGGIYAYSGTLTIANNVFFANTAAFGGGLYCCSSATGDLTNNTIARNSARDGGGIYLSTVTTGIRNNVIAFNTNGIYNTGPVPSLRTTNDVYNPDGYDFSGLTAAATDKTSDPKFADLMYGNLHLQTNSPCKDAGYNSAVQDDWTDIDGQPRVQFSRPDMGADESDGTTWNSTSVVVRVSQSGSDANDGSSWESAKQTVQAAIDAAASAGGGEVWVAAGDHAGGVALKPFVYVYGGFDGSEVSRDGRDWAQNTTSMVGAVSAQGIGYRLSAFDGFKVANSSSIYCSKASPEIRNNLIRNNRATSAGELSGGGGISCYRSSAVIASNTVADNGDFRMYGGGIGCFYKSHALICNNLITGNIARGYGGGIYTNWSGPIIANNVIWSNLVLDIDTGYGGGGVYCASAEYLYPLLVNNTIVANCAGAGGGLYAIPSAAAYNNVIAFNSSGIYGGPTLGNNLVYNPDGYNYSTGIPGTGDKQVDPLFASAQLGNVHIKPGSPCINAGNDSMVAPGAVDLDGQPRKSGTHVDIGADEYDGTAWVVTPRVVYVSAAGDDSCDGSSWDRAKRTVQAGVDAASTTGGEVWVARGIYRESVTIGQCVYLYGGFAGVETQRSQRDTSANETVLEKGVTSAAVTSLGRGYRCTAVDGFTIRNSGTGVTCADHSVEVTNCVIRDNSTGVGLSRGCAAVIGNRLLHNGTGVAGGNSSAVVVIGNEIRGSLSTGLSSSHGLLSALNNHIIGSGNHGIAISSSDGTIANNVISGNRAAGNGGGILWDFCKKGSLVNNTIVGNSATAGGGISCATAPVSVANNIVAFNTSGIQVSGTAPVLSKNDVFNPEGNNYEGISAGTGDVSVDPQLVSAQYGELHIQPGSPCRNAGSDAVLQTGWRDIDDEPRIQGTSVDIGADESDGIVRQFAPIVVYVSATGGDGNDGSSWDHAKRTIQAGVTAASERGGEVWVREGIYAESIYWYNYCDLYGGFAGTETVRQDRDWVTNRTVIRGDGSRSTVQTVGYVMGTLSGFTITGGNASGGICTMVSKPVIANNTITGNRIGITNTVRNPTIKNNVIAANGSDGISGSGLPSIIGNTIALNGGVGINCASGVAANNIVARNAGGVKTGSSLVLRSNCVYGNPDYNYSGIADPTGSNGNISNDPVFASTDLVDLHIQPGSPCVEAGSDSDVQAGSFDVDGDARIQSTHVDIGADESDGVERVINPAVIRVSPSGSDSQDGSSWESAKLTVQAAIDLASVPGGEVWVAAGTYNECIRVPAGVRIYGGFAGVEGARGESDPSAHTTTLDGQAGGRVVSISDTGLSVAVVDGFTVRGGYHTDGGAGVYCCYSSAEIRGNRITANEAGHYGGGGIRGYYARLTMTDNAVSANRAGYYGGGGVRLENSTAQMRGNSLTDNTAVYSDGGGLRIEGSAAVLSGNNINNNSGRAGAGLFASSSGVDLSASSICGNSGSQSGGGVYVVGGNLAMSTCVVAKNSAGESGGGVYSSSADLTVTNSTIVEGNASLYGGAIFRSAGNVSVSNCLIAFNSSGLYAPTYGQTTPMVLNSNCVYGNTAYDYRNVAVGQGDISVDPLFVNRAGGDYHLSLFSPCINSGWNDAPGLPTTDMDGEARIQGGTVDIGADECWLSAEVIRDAKRAANGMQVDFTDAIVTAVFDGFLYVEAVDRSMGIRVEKAGHGLQAGAKVNITGVLNTNADGERYIEASTITQTGNGSIEPLHIVSKYLGGVDWLYNASTGAGQQGVVGGAGLNNIGMYVTTWGKMSYLLGAYQIGDTKVEAAKVVLEGIQAAGLTTYVQITGVVSCYKDADGLHPTILATDIKPLN